MVAHTLPMFRRRRSFGKSARGFSLIEAMVASFVFTVGALGLLRLMYGSAQGITVAGKVTQATALAKSQLDVLTHLPYTNTSLAVGTYKDGSNNLGPAGFAFDANGNATGAWGCSAATFDGWFARSWTVTEPVADSLKIINVSVCWWDPSSKTARNVSVAGGKSIQ